MKEDNIIVRLKKDIAREAFRKHPNLEKIKYLEEQLELQKFHNQIH